MGKKLLYLNLAVMSNLIMTEFLEKMLKLLHQEVNIQPHTKPQKPPGQTLRLRFLSLHHLYRAMAFLGEEIEDQKDCTPFAPRCTKDVMEEDLFLAMVIRKELDCRLEKAGHCFEWADIKRDLKALQDIAIEDRGKTLAIRSECLGTCGKIFQAVGVAIPPTIREAV